MLRLENLSCGYGREPVVRDISLTLSEGERLAVLGPNGCGKTTLLRGIMGILPSAGVLELEGKSLRAMTVRERARALAMFAQMSGAAFSYTVMETVLLGRYPHRARGLFGAFGPEDRRAAQEQLRRLNLWEERDRLITELSGGQLQRVLLARAFVQEPKVILLDEPTNHLDLRFQVELVEELGRWVREPGRAAIGVFHDLDLALSFADRVLLMEQGKTVFLGRTKELDFEALSRVYGMDVPGYMRRSRARWERTREDVRDAAVCPKEKETANRRLNKMGKGI